jgi:hypothetical protein
MHRIFSCELASCANLIESFPLEHCIPDEQAYARHHEGRSLLLSKRLFLRSMLPKSA